MSLPRSITDPFCPQGHVVTEPADRRWLWHLEGSLAVLATTHLLREQQHALRQYLNSTCLHHWHDSEADGDIAAHRQCLWCCTVEWADEVRS